MGERVSFVCPTYLTHIPWPCVIHTEAQEARHLRASAREQRQHRQHPSLAGTAAEATEQRESMSKEDLPALHPAPPQNSEYLTTTPACSPSSSQGGDERPSYLSMSC